MTEGLASGPNDALIRFMVDRLSRGVVVPFLGAGVNCCGRPAQFSWRADSAYLPAGAELSLHLAKAAQYPKESDDERKNLLRVAQYLSTTQGGGALRDELHTIFDREYQPTAVHRFFAGLTGVLQAKNYPRDARDLKGFQQLIVTTNYDDLLEQAFRDAGVEFDLLIYKAMKGSRGWFWHINPKGDAVQIQEPNKYDALSLDVRPVIVKIHGAINRGNPVDDGYVITEDDYIDYLAGADLSNFLPMVIKSELVKSHFLFLGYSLQDWNLRVFLKRIWDEQEKYEYKCWAIQLKVEDIDRELWKSRKVDIIAASLEDYMKEMTQRVNELPTLPPRQAGNGS